MDIDIDISHHEKKQSSGFLTRSDQGSKCPSLPGFAHGFYPGKPGLGFKPYFEKVGT